MRFRRDDLIVPLRECSAVRDIPRTRFRPRGWAFRRAASRQIGTSPEHAARFLAYTKMGIKASYAHTQTHHIDVYDPRLENPRLREKSALHERVHFVCIHLVTEFEAGRNLLEHLPHVRHVGGSQRWGFHREQSVRAGGEHSELATRPT